ncbi:PH domain-containing protein [Microbacterium amylolyticum]|uniref:Low molecular weight protein antigen 6 PH domain-containing protein n=1 Tax=Microbacterium amylolyticum TaxID=936337 RepID=A0ABS4ZKD1_9MICO|nr:PH domain-containing protein [Microbacterium amylolyticum]MBP2437752.1 hypothetical protein [Microbacterium amylolyticum]
MSQPTNRIVFRSTSGWVSLALVAVVSAVLLGDVAIRSSLYDAFLVAPWLLAVAWFVWVFSAWPQIDADSAGVRLRNPLRVIDIPWARVESIRLRFQAEFTLRDGGRVTAWGGAGRRMRGPRKNGGEDPAELQVEALEQLHEESGPSDRAVSRTFDPLTVGIGVLVLIWLGGSVTLAGGLSI